MKLSTTEIDQAVISAINNLDRVSNTAVPRASAMAVNRVGKRAISLSVRDTSKDVNVPVKVLRRRAKLFNATFRTPVAIIRVSRGSVSLSSVGAIRKTRDGVRVGRHSVKGGFVADGSAMKGQYLGRGKYAGTSLMSTQILKRTGKGRYPVEVQKINISKPITQFFKQRTSELMKTDMPKELKAALAQQLRLIIRRS